LTVSFDTFNPESLTTISPRFGRPQVEGGRAIEQGLESPGWPRPPRTDQLTATSTEFYASGIFQPMEIALHQFIEALTLCVWCRASRPAISSCQSWMDEFPIFQKRM